MSRTMQLSQLLPDVPGIPPDLAISGLALDSRDLRAGDVFVAVGGFGSREALRQVMEYADMFYYDLKLVDGEAHRKWTGVDNAQPDLLVRIAGVELWAGR